jgi:hypothetical protein
MLQIAVSLTDDSRGIIYDRKMFIVMSIGFHKLTFYGRNNYRAVVS